MDSQTKEMIRRFRRCASDGSRRRLLPVAALLCSLAAAGCASSIAVDNWQSLPHNTPIEVHLTDGSTRRCEIWRMTEDSSIVGLVKTDSGQWRNVSVPQRAIRKVALTGTESHEWVADVTVVTGCVAGAAAVAAVIVVLAHIPAIETTGLLW